VHGRPRAQALGTPQLFEQLQSTQRAAEPRAQLATLLIEVTGRQNLRSKKELGCCSIETTTEFMSGVRACVLSHVPKLTYQKYCQS